MVKEKTVLLVPPGHNRRPAGRYDEVRESDEVSSPKVIQEVVPEDGDTSVDRSLVSADSKKKVAESRRNYNAAKNAGDLQAQIDALEVVVDDLWNIVTGETVDDTEGSYPPDEV
ncbi:hypothetical protein HSTV2_36 [Halorubrum sodomense tailed virus 2]|uniref:Uncharacterized protein n=1 Tax=Halorubrum sodomense tailed virus 2 TaxID=1262527 RepID=L7TK01_9CAUD|nr:hypothetical protein HSTV2_36 [Halorubrum sodomense tailed virus 2]AGC34305.1 hypothetical protein HSTV2_36 [Halorubrum sodomense tailed virus 2]